MHCKRFLMAPPDYFTVSYAINPWMEKSAQPVDHALAVAQWRDLRTAIEDRADVQTLEPAAGAPDLCFVANAGVLHKGIFIPSRFRHRERRCEESHFENWFAQRGYMVKQLPAGIFFEGAGDALFERTGTTLWMGHGQRTQKAAVAEVGRILHVDVVALRLRDPRFYHLDTCFCPLRSGELIYFPGAFDAQSLRSIRARVPVHKRIEVCEDDAIRFACNAVDLGDRLLMNGASDALRARLALSGIDVRLIDLSEFLKSGGSAKCLTFALSEPLRRECVADNSVTHERLAVA